MTQRAGWVLMGLMLAGCSHNAYLEQSLAGAIGKDKAWVEKQYGTPEAKATSFFGKESWTYYRIAGGKSGPPLFNFSPNECQITVKFDKEERVSDYSYSGC
ncbi:hypothetical protein YTPLAS18_04050 [Nitrospira sp.]|nr:hypothetical protein YTPLAS18_04050 [Nitrospira sp.]